MKNTPFWIGRSLIAAIALIISLPTSAETWIRYQARPGSKLRIDGSSSAHDWTVESKIIGGYMELESNFPLEPGKAPPKGGKVNAKAEVNVSVLSLKSEKPAMDEVMHAAMKHQEHPKVKYQLKQLTLLPATAGAPPKYEAIGELTVAGVTKPNQMQVTIVPVDESRVKVSGEANVKMSDFGIAVKPPPPLGLILKIQDEVKITFEWLTARQKDTAQAR